MRGSPEKTMRYRFGDFVLSARTRTLSRGGVELPLISRYFDLLVLLVVRRGTAVTRQDIFDIVWSDVIVSDGALSQAIRTLRRTLGDGSREPIYIRTVARHGYRFVYGNVVEEDDPGTGEVHPVQLVPAVDAGDTLRTHTETDRLSSKRPDSTHRSTPGKPHRCPRPSADPSYTPD